MSYCYSTNEEIFYGDYATELEALGTAFDEMDKKGMKVRFA